MAHLGTITAIRPSQVSPRPLVSVFDYNIYRGFDLGHIAVFDNNQFTPALVAPLSGYTVRQLTVVFRQLWPSHGQRFPQ